jgi:hypothetical protein
VGSDHLPLIASVGQSQRVELRKRRLWSQTDWFAFHEEVMDQLGQKFPPPMLHNDDIDDAVVSLFNALNMATKCHVPMKLIKPRRPPWWTDELRRLQKEMQHCFRKYRDWKFASDLTEHKRLQAIFRQKIRVAKKASWERHTQSLDAKGAIRLLGRNFWPSLDKKEIENEVLKQFEDVMDNISKSNNVTDNIRLHTVQHFIHTFLRWHLTIYPISVSWIDQNLTRLMTQYVKKWSGIMKKASPEILYISKQQGGLGFPDLTSVFKQSQLTRADILSTSVDPLIRTGNHGNWLVPVGVPETDLSAYSRRRLKIGKPPRNTREDVY